MNLRRAGIPAIGALALALGGGTLALLPGPAAAKITPLADASSDQVTATGILIKSSTGKFSFLSSGSGTHPCTLSSTGDAPVRCVLTAHGTIDSSGKNFSGTTTVTSRDGTLNLPFFDDVGCGTETEHGVTEAIFGDIGFTGSATPTNSPAISTATVVIDASDSCN